MNSPLVPINDTEQVFNNDLWHLALQTSIPVSASSLPPTSLPLDFVTDYSQCLANYPFIPPHFNDNIFTQYPSIPADGEAQPYPSVDHNPLAVPQVLNFPTLLPTIEQGHLSESSFTQDDSSLNDSNTFVDTSTETGSTPTSPTDFLGSPSLTCTPEPSPSPEPETKRRSKRKSSSAATKRRKSSSSSAKSGKSSNLDRIRERNRISAQRFRDKKKADAIDLELRTHKLSEQRDTLVREITDLQWQSIMLQEQCLRQVMCGCDDMKKFFRNKTSLHEKLCQTELHCHS